MKTNSKTSRARSAKASQKRFSPLLQTARSHLKIVTVVAVFAVIGVVFLFRSFAATTSSYRLWSNDTTPAFKSYNDTNPAEVGVKFQPTVAGNITAISFYKGRANQGTHTGTLWTSSGKALATVTFSNESRSGWQTARFAKPIPVSANTTYVASYYAPNSRYAANSFFFNQTYSKGPLKATAGVYKYSNKSTFPTESYHNTNYWVDVTLQVSTSSPVTPPAPVPAPTPPAPAPAPVPTPTPPAPSPVTPPSTSGTWPSGWDDPRFANNVASGPKFNNGSSMVTWQNLTVNDNSGQASFGYGNYSLLNSRIKSREGPRISGSNILIQDSYIEVAGVGDDHGDGIQAYGSTSGSNSNFQNVVVRRTKVVLTGGALNAGIFLADRSGVDLTLDTVYVDGGPAPNGALFFANSADGSDKGCNSLVLRHVRVAPKVRFEGLSSCNIKEWTDVAYVNGTPIAKPN